MTVYSLCYSKKNPKPKCCSKKGLPTGITQLHFCFTSLVKEKNPNFFFFLNIVLYILKMCKLTFYTSVSEQSL